MKHGVLYLLLAAGVLCLCWMGPGAGEPVPPNPYTQIRIVYPTDGEPMNGRVNFQVSVNYPYACFLEVYSEDSSLLASVCVNCEPPYPPEGNPPSLIGFDIDTTLLASRKQHLSFFLFDMFNPLVPMASTRFLLNVQNPVVRKASSDERNVRVNVWAPEGDTFMVLVAARTILQDERTPIFGNLMLPVGTPWEIVSVQPVRFPGRWQEVVLKKPLIRSRQTVWGRVYLFAVTYSPKGGGTWKASREEAIEDLLPEDI